MKSGMFKKILSLTLVVLILLTAVFATGCAKKDKDKDKDEITIEDIKEKAEKEGYTVTEAKEAEISSMNDAILIMGIDGEFTAAIVIEKETDDDYPGAEIYEFNKASAAKDFAEKYPTFAGKFGEYETIEQSGKCVIVGDTAAVEDIW